MGRARRYIYLLAGLLAFSPINSGQEISGNNRLNTYSSQVYQPRNELRVNYEDMKIKPEELIPKENIENLPVISEAVLEMDEEEREDYAQDELKDFFRKRAKEYLADIDIYHSAREWFDSEKEKRLTLKAGPDIKFKEGGVEKHIRPIRITPEMSGLTSPYIAFHFRNPTHVSAEARVYYNEAELQVDPKIEFFGFKAEFEAKYEYNGKTSAYLTFTRPF